MRLSSKQQSWNLIPYHRMIAVRRRKAKTLRSFSTQIKVTLALPLPLPAAETSPDKCGEEEEKEKEEEEMSLKPWDLRGWEAVTPVGSTGGWWLQSRLCYLHFYLHHIPAAYLYLDWLLAIHTYVLSRNLVMAWNRELPMCVLHQDEAAADCLCWVTIEIGKTRVKWPIVRHPARCNRSERVLAGKLWSYCALLRLCEHCPLCNSGSSSSSPIMPCHNNYLSSLSPSPRVPILPSLPTSTKKSRCIVLRFSPLGGCHAVLKSDE